MISFIINFQANNKLDDTINKYILLKETPLILLRKPRIITEHRKSRISVYTIIPNTKVQQISTEKLYIKH